MSMEFVSVPLFLIALVFIWKGSWWMWLGFIAFAYLLVIAMRVIGGEVVAVGKSKG